MSDEDRDWLERNDRPLAEQLRRDLGELRRLRHITMKQPAMPIIEAIDLAQAVWVEK
jgi:hypothetical protein